MQYVIGVDAGGTSTEVGVYSLKGSHLYQTKTGFGNLLNDRKKAIYNILEGIKRVFERFEKSECCLVVIGSAGIDTGDNKDYLKNHVYEQFKIEVSVINDAQLAHFALLEDKDGCLVISGTGSVVYGYFNNEMYRVGGWGHLLGDEGSGYSIVVSLIKDILFKCDANMPLSQLENEFLNHLDIKNALKLARFVYDSKKDNIAKNALFVSKMAEEGDKQARILLKDAGIELARQVRLLLNRVNLNNHINVAVTGSVLLHNDYVYHTFTEELIKTSQTINFIRKEMSNTKGSYYYFLQNNTVK